MTIFTITFAQIKDRAFTVQTNITLIPDSLVIISKNDTSYLIVTHGNGFLTKNPNLFRKIMNHMNADTSVFDGIDNIVTIEGTSMGALSKFYRKQFKGSVNKERANELNGYLYRITGYKLDYQLAGAVPVVETTPQIETAIKTEPPTETKPASTPEPVKVSAPARPTIQQLREREAYRKAHPRG